MRKLIRDAMARTIGLGPGDKLSLCKNNKEYEELLVEKLKEEYTELRKELVKSEVDIDAVAEEAGDLLEVIFAVADHFASVGEKNLIEICYEKRGRRGAFNAGVVLETRD